MKTAVEDSFAREISPPPLGATSVETLPRKVVEIGARFVPQTLRYLGVPDGDLFDAAQDVFVVVLRRYGDFEGRSSLTTWLYGICIRIAHNYRRKKRSNRELLVDRMPESTAPPPQELAVEQKEWRRALQVLLDQLDEGQRAAFVLYEIERLPMKDVADALGCPLQTAYSRHHAARSRVLEAFKRHTAEREQ